MEGFSGRATEGLEQQFLNKDIESEAAVLETGLEGLTPEQQQILQSFDERIETEFRKLDMIEHMEQIDKSWRDGLNHSFQVDRIRMLISEIGDCGLWHADDAEFSALLMEKADLVHDRLSDRCEQRAQVLLKRLDRFEEDLISSPHG